MSLAKDLKAARIAWEQRVPQRILDWAMEADPLVTLDEMAFVDRTAFRGLLPRITKPDTPACVVVSGEPQSGKSYLAEFCHAFARARPGIRISCVERKGHPSWARARTLARQLGDKLGTPRRKKPPEHEEDERDAHNLARRKATCRRSPSSTGSTIPTFPRRCTYSFASWRGGSVPTRRCGPGCALCSRPTASPGLSTAG